MMQLSETKAKKLEPIKQYLEQYANYRIESIDDGLLIVFPYRYWLDGDGMSVNLLLEDDLDTLVVQDDDFCIHNFICLDSDKRDDVLSMAKYCELVCFYDEGEHAAPIFYASASLLSVGLNRIDIIIERIESFLRRLIVFNWMVYHDNGERRNM